MQSLHAQEVIADIKSLAQDNEMVVVRVDGKDQVVKSVTRGFDGVIGAHIIITTMSITEVV